MQRQLHVLRLPIPRQEKALEVSLQATASVAKAAKEVAEIQKDQLTGIQNTLEIQTGILKQSIDYQTQVIEDSKVINPGNGKTPQGS